MINATCSLRQTGVSTLRVTHRSLSFKVVYRRRNVSLWNALSRPSTDLLVQVPV